MINEHIYRRFNHTVAACFVIYFLFPQYILGINRGYYLFLFWVLILVIEYLRLNKELNVLGMREYEKKRLASFVWFASGTCLILGMYEIGAFPQSLAIATIIMAAYTDPVIGEANKKFGDKGGMIAGLACSFLIFQIILGTLFYSILGSIIAVIAEKPRLKWFDDDLAIQIFPITILTIISLIEGAPYLPQNVLEESL
jgi:hypothetical protein